MQLNLHAFGVHRWSGNFPHKSIYMSVVIMRNVTDLGLVSEICVIKHSLHFLIDIYLHFESFYISYNPHVRPCQCIAQWAWSSKSYRRDVSSISWATFIAAWITTSIHRKVWDQIIVQSLYFNVEAIFVWEWVINFAPPFIVDAIAHPYRNYC